MEKIYPLGLTEQELRLLNKLLTETPIQGTVKTLPGVLGAMLGIIKKISNALEGHNE